MMSVVAKYLLSLGMTQKSVAERLYISQPAISLYKKDARGIKARISPELHAELVELAKRISQAKAEKNVLEKEILQLYIKHFL